MLHIWYTAFEYYLYYIIFRHISFFSIIIFWSYEIYAFFMDSSLCSRYTTVMLIEMPRFSVAKLLLHHYKSDLAHTSDRCSSVIELYLSETWVKKIEKWMTRSVATKFAQFWVISVRKCMVKKYLISDRFSFLDRLFSVIFW